MPKRIVDAYNNGMKGCILNPDTVDEYLDTIKYARFRQAASQLVGSGKEKESALLYLSTLKFDPKFGGKEPQRTGDCFLDNAPVLTPNGYRAIATIKIGDEVIAPNGRKRPVIDVIKKPYSGKIVTLYTTHGPVATISATPDHKIWVWSNDKTTPTPIEDIKVGDRLVVLNPYARTAIVNRIQYNEFSGDVYCLNVDVDHAFVVNNIAVNNCVSHGVRNAVDTTRAVEMDIKGEPEAWDKPGATENIYQARGHYGQGMDPVIAAKYISKVGGLLLRKKYKGCDLSRYNPTLGIKHKIPREIYKDEAHQHPIIRVAYIETIEDLRDALSNGYACTIASGWGFTSRRDKKGRVTPRGSWNHQMSILGYDDENPGYLIQNSWGKDWISGPTWKNQPPGSFWVSKSVMEDWLPDATVFAYSDFKGFRVKPLPHYGLGEWL